jgi:glycosyltransferase involved in cell wall biosynthesis
VSDPRLRILIAHDYGTLNGGAELMVDAQRRLLRARGHEVLLFTSAARPLPLPIVSDATCLGTVSSARRVLKVANPFAVRALRRALRVFRPDIVHVKMFLTQLSPLILPLVRPFPSVLQIVNYDLICPLNTKTLRDGTPCHDRAGAACHRTGCLPWAGVARTVAQRRLTDLSVFDRVVTNSRHVAGRLRAEGIRVDGTIPNGVPPRDARPPLEGPPVVGFAGRLVWKKGVDVLIGAMARVVERRPDVRLVIAGDGPERSRLEARAAELGIGGSVDFLGHLARPDMEANLDRAWVRVVPSRWEEPFGLTAAEAMMAGTAVVATGSGGLAEQVLDGETGLLFPSQDDAALAGAIERLIGDRALAERLGAAGRRRAVEEYGEDRYVERFLDLYREVMAPSGGAGRAVVAG